MPNLYAELSQLHESGLYPFHMPGHKQRTDLFEEDLPVLSGVYGIDTTETAFTDDLFHPQGMIAALQERSNHLYGDGRADLETRLLVNGSTSGILAAVSALTNEGDTVIVARNAHRALYHALYLRRLHVVYVQPQISEKYAFAGPVSPDDVANAFQVAPEAKAVFITSPTYEGVLSDVALIAVVTHAHGVPLIVDEAHGSHLGLYQDLPRGAIGQGADVVIHSLHKTLAGMTQTAFLHMQGALADREKIDRFLRVYQTSSPSFPLMVSMDAAVSDLAKNGVYRFETLLAYKQMILTESVALRTMRVAPQEAVPDPAKVVIIPELINGLQLAYMLRTEYRIEPEMALLTHVVCILTPYDTEEGVERLMEALYGIDRELYEAAYGPEEENAVYEEEPYPGEEGDAFLPILSPEEVYAMAQGISVPEEIAAIPVFPEEEGEALFMPEGTIPEIIQGSRHLQTLSEAVSGQETEYIRESTSVQETEYVTESTSVQETEYVTESTSVQETEYVTGDEAVRETEYVTEEEAVPDTESGTEEGTVDEPEEEAEPVWERVVYDADGSVTSGAVPLQPVAYMSIADAWDAPNGTVSLAGASGLISADFIYTYPPGIPLIVPGEAFTAEICAYLLSRCATENMHGVTPDGMVRCVLAQSSL